MQRKYSLHSIAKGDFSNGKCRGYLVLLHRHDHTLEELDTILLPFSDFYMNAHRVPRAKPREIGPDLRLLNCIHQIHDTSFSLLTCGSLCPQRAPGDSSGFSPAPVLYASARFQHGCRKGELRERSIRENRRAVCTADGPASLSKNSRSGSTRRIPGRLESALLQSPTRPLPVSLRRKE